MKVITLNDFNYYHDVDLVKDLLSDTRTVYKIFIEQCCAEDGKYWQVERYKFVLNGPDKQPPRSVTHGYQKIDNFYTDTLDHAVAYLVLNQTSNYNPIPTLAGYDDTLYRLCIDYEYDSIQDQKNYKLVVDEIQVRSNRHTVVYTAEGACLNILLFRIPLIMREIEKWTPYGFHTDEVVELNPIIRFPYFLLDGIIFKSKIYYHEKKEIWGTSPNYWNTYDNSNQGRFNIYKVKMFMEERIVYIINRWAYYNGKKKLVFNKNLSPITFLGNHQDVMKAYPNAIGISRDGVMDRWA
jgi:hypothetical protein